MNNTIAKPAVIVSSSVAISNPRNITIDLEFDFALCHTQYSYCRYWH